MLLVAGIPWFVDPMVLLCELRAVAVAFTLAFTLAAAAAAAARGSAVQWHGDGDDDVLLHG